MGGFVASSRVFLGQADLNVRFSDEGIAEMVALHQEFGIFTGEHSLSSAAALLGLAPVDEPQRGQWFAFIDYLATLPSDLEDQNGHDRIRNALRSNLEGAGRPVFFEYHAAADDPRVKVTTAQPLVFSPTTHIVISVPTQNARDAARAAVKRAPTWTVRKAAKQARAPAAKPQTKPAAKSAAKKAKK